MSEPWWRTLPTTYSCHHPPDPVPSLTPGRYLIFPDVEMCGLCSAIRPASERGTYWPPNPRVEPIDWTPHSEC